MRIRQRRHLNQPSRDRVCGHIRHHPVCSILAFDVLLSFIAGLGHLVTALGLSFSLALEDVIQAPPDL